MYITFHKFYFYSLLGSRQVSLITNQFRIANLTDTIEWDSQPNRHTFRKAAEILGSHWYCIVAGNTRQEISKGQRDSARKTTLMRNLWWFMVCFSSRFPVSLSFKFYNSVRLLIVARLYCLLFFLSLSPGLLHLLYMLNIV